jgi:hypothetical protein
MTDQSEKGEPCPFRRDGRGFMMPPTTVVSDHPNDQEEVMNHMSSKPTGDHSTKIRTSFKMISAMLAGFIALGCVATVVAKPAFASGTGTLVSGQVLTANQGITSTDNRFSLVMQGDGNLVVYYTGGPALWSSGTYNHPGAYVAMQTDGNLVVYPPSGRALWSSGTYNHPGAYVAMQTDGNLVVYPPSGSALWASNTGGHSAGPPTGGQSGQTYNGKLFNIQYLATWDSNKNITVSQLSCAPHNSSSFLGFGLTPIQPGYSSWCGAGSNGTTLPGIGGNATFKADCGLLGIIPYTWLTCMIDPFKFNVEERAQVRTTGPSFYQFWIQQCGGLPVPGYTRVANCYQ